MNTELIFKIAFVTMFVGLLGTMMYFRPRNSGNRSMQERIKDHNQHEVKALLVLRTALGLPWYAAIFAWLFVPQFIVWSALPLPVWLRWAGVAVAAAGLLLNAWSQIALRAKLGDAYNPMLRLQTSPTLVTDGPYAWMRHPVYLAFLLMMIATTLLTANWLIGGLGIALILSVILVRIPEEERQLLTQFNEGYRAYAAHIGWFAPRLSFFQSRGVQHDH